MKIAVIPARGGSKRIPRKNIREFRGKPIIAWSIEAALMSSMFDAVVVSTDDLDIAEVARSHGAHCPFLRPAGLSDDITPTIPVIKHAIEWLAANGKIVTHACCIYATAPFVRPDDLLRSYDSLRTSNLDFVTSVTTFPFPIDRAIRIAANGRVQMLDASKYLVRSQDLEEKYHDAGQFYWGTARAWTEESTVFGENSGAFILPRERVQDIDTLEDWRYAELMHQAQHLSNNSESSSC